MAEGPGLVGGTKVAIFIRRPTQRPAEDSAVVTVCRTGAAPDPTTPQSTHDDRMGQPTRRRVLSGLPALAAGGAAGAVVGGALGYRYRHQIHDIWRTSVANGDGDTPGARAFFAEDARLRALRDQQTADDALALKAHYAAPVIGPVTMWSLIERMGLCIDTTDRQLFATSQLVHVQQILAAMERHGVTEPSFFLIALLHDVGKVATLHGGRPEDIFGGADPLRHDPARNGLDHVIFQFSHAELIYPRIKDFVPEAVAWTVRYHNIDIASSLPLMTARERALTERYLRPFRRFDGGYKSFHYAPPFDIASYRALIEDYFPEPIMF